MEIQCDGNLIYESKLTGQILINKMQLHFIDCMKFVSRNISTYSTVENPNDCSLSTCKCERKTLFLLRIKIFNFSRIITLLRFILNSMPTRLTIINDYDTSCHVIGSKISVQSIYLKNKFWFSCSYPFIVNIANLRIKKINLISSTFVVNILYLQLMIIWTNVRATNRIQFNMKMLT